jgi:hypothetical protein
MGLFDQFRHVLEEDSDEDNASPAPSSSAKATSAPAVPCKRKGKLAVFDLTVSSGAQPPHAPRAAVPPRTALPKGGTRGNTGPPNAWRTPTLQTERVWCYLTCLQAPSLRLPPTHNPPHPFLTIATRSPDHTNRHSHRIYTPTGPRLWFTERNQEGWNTGFGGATESYTSCDADDEPEAPVVGRTGAQKASNAFDIKVRTKGENSTYS